MFKTLTSYDTQLAADSVEWCPIESFRDILVCGTYQLSQNEQAETTETANLSKRFGRIYVFRVSARGELQLLQQLNVAAILDMKWAHVLYDNKILLGVANSLGYLQLYEFKNEDGGILTLISEVKINDTYQELLALSIDWCSQNSIIAVSDSQGCISLFQYNDANLNKMTSWHAHKFEAWIVGFDYWNMNLTYTGGDDCKFQCFDVRIGIPPIIVNKTHTAGVTSIHSNISKEFILVSGSYDETLRIWDRRTLKRPVSEKKLDGGIWRLKWDPFEHRYVLAACMYGGFRIIDCYNTDAPVICGKYNEHESISYGCDWSFLTNNNIRELKIFESQNKNALIVGTCSFYDHVLKISTVELDAQSTSER